MDKAKTKIKFYTDRESWATQASVTMMALSVVFRLIGCWGLWTDTGFAYTQIALPVLSGLLFILAVLLLGRVALWSTVLPVLLGVVFFIIKAMGFESWLHMVLCILLYLLVAVLYTGTVFGLIQTKLLLLPLFALPFAYHVAVEDLPALMDTANPVSFAAGMQEMSVLSIMLSLFFISLAMKKKRVAPKEEAASIDTSASETPAPEDSAPAEPETPETAEPEVSVESTQTQEKTEVPAEGEETTL